VRLDELRELLPLYVLQALPESEYRRVEEGLERYPELWAELRALQETAADLSQLTTKQPSPELKARVLALVRTTDARLSSPDPPTTGGPEPLLLSRNSPPRAAVWPRWVASAVVVAVLGFLGWCGMLAYPWVEAFTDPHSQFVTLVNEKNQAVGRCILRKDGLALIWVNLPPPPPGKTYQLWGVQGEQHIGLDTFRGGLKVFRMPPGFQVVHITEEQAGGSQYPTQIRALPIQN
jgi:hypothetical protein